MDSISFNISIQLAGYIWIAKLHIILNYLLVLEVLIILVVLYNKFILATYYGELCFKETSYSYLLFMTKSCIVSYKRTAQDTCMLVTNACSYTIIYITMCIIVSNKIFTYISQLLSYYKKHISFIVFASTPRAKPIH